MNNNRNLVILAAVFVLLVSAWALTRDRRPELDTTGGFVDLVEGQLSTDEVYTVEVTHGVDGEGFTLVQRDGAWFVSSHYDAPANLNKIRTLLGNIETVSGEVRSDDASVLDAYALDEPNAYHVRVAGEGGETLAELLIGKRSANGSFVRAPGSDQVLLADHNFLSDFGVWGDERQAPAVTSWIDLVAFTAERDDIRTVTVEGENSFVMTKEFVEAEPAVSDTTATEPAVQDPNAYEWRITSPENFVASKTRADGVMNALTSVRARDVVGDTVQDEYGLGEDARRVTVTLEDGTSHTLLFGAPTADDETLLYFKVEGESLVWSLPQYVANNVFKSVDDLRTES